jgi:hypothetical protein
LRRRAWAHRDISKNLLKTTTGRFPSLDGVLSQKAERIPRISPPPGSFNQGGVPARHTAAAVTIEPARPTISAFGGRWKLHLSFVGTRIDLDTSETMSLPNMIAAVRGSQQL